jgi:integrase
MGRKRLAKNRGFPPNLYQNPAGYFYYKHPRTKKQKGLGKDRAKAFQEARAANAVLATMAPTPLADWVAGKSDHTLASWLPVYKEVWLEDSDPPPAKATLRSCTMYVKRLADAPFAWMRLRDITAQHISDYLDTVKAESGAATANCLRARMSDVFRRAETKGLIEVGKSPVAATRAPRPTVKRERLSLEQFRAIHAHAPVWLQRAMYLALTTAQRRDDIAKMMFADWRDGNLHVEQGKGRGAVKLRLDGRIRLTKVGVSIADAVQACRDLIVSQYLVHHVEHNGTAKPGHRVTSNGLSNAFQAAREAAGIEAQDGRTPPSFHEIRSLAERLYKDEFGAAFAQAMLGHKNASMTEKYDDPRGGWQSIAAK